MKIKLLPGDHEWALKGTHVCDDLGIAKILDKELELDVDASVAERILPIIGAARVARGLMPDGSLPPPPPPPEVEPAVEPVEPEIDPEVEPEVNPVLQASRPRKKKEV
jgi:hypothetical protein